jgi:hypothetical protein
MAPPKQSRPSSEVENSEAQAKQDSTAATSSVPSQNIPDKVKESGTVARANDEVGTIRSRPFTSIMLTKVAATFSQLVRRRNVATKTEVDSFYPSSQRIDPGW